MTLNAAVQSGTLTPEVQEKLIDELWNPRVISSEKNTRNTSTYLRYYRDQCEQSLVDRGRYSSARRHEDILHVAKLISKDQLGHEEILQRLRTQCDDDQRQNVTDDALRGTMNLAARLLSMMKIGTWRYEFSSQKRIHWTGGTLQQCISGWFEGPTLDHENIKLEKLFNGANLGTISGLKIVWTDNIAEHLSLQNNDQEVVTFHHASFLKGHGT